MDIRKLAPGDRVLDYRILERIGEGGFGEVFRAEHEVLGTIVAIKVPRDENGLTALRHEGVVQASLNHPNIVATRELSISYDPPFIVMDYVDGDSLAELLRREGALSWRRAARVLLEVAVALDHAHQRGVVHGDVKPANILVEPGREGRVLLTDFGLGRVFEGPQGNLQISRSLELATSGAEVQGTIRYLAPELLRGESADERADVYSFGVLLFETLTGGLPEGREVPSDLAPKVPSELDDLFAAAFTRREKRPRSLASTIAGLESMLGREGEREERVAPPRPSALLTPPLVTPEPSSRVLVGRNQVAPLAPAALLPAAPPLGATRPTRTTSKPPVTRGLPPVPPHILHDCCDPPVATEVVQALPAQDLEPSLLAPSLNRPNLKGPLGTAVADPNFQTWRRAFLARVRRKMSTQDGLEACEARGFDLCYGVSVPGDPQHRVYVLCLPKVDAELALAAAEKARRAFEEEKGIWEKEVTFWIVTHEVEDQDQVLWTFKSFCMGWWRRRRIVLHTPKNLVAGELGCDPKGNHLKRSFDSVCSEALDLVPLVRPTPVTRTCAPYSPRRSRGALWGASVALMMTCGLLGSIGALDLATRSMRAQPMGAAGRAGQAEVTTQTLSSQTSNSRTSSSQTSSSQTLSNQASKALVTSGTSLEAVTQDGAPPSWIGSGVGGVLDDEITPGVDRVGEALQPEQAQADQPKQEAKPAPKQKKGRFF